MSRTAPVPVVYRARRALVAPGLQPTDDQAVEVVVDGGTIGSVRPAGTAPLPADAEVVDLGSATILPGLIDTHVHLASQNGLTNRNTRLSFHEVPPELAQMQALYHAQVCLEMGFTTLRDMGWTSAQGHLLREMLAVRDAIDDGLAVGPRILVAGWSVITSSHLDLLYPRGLLERPEATADGPWALRAQTRRNLRDGADFVKTCLSGGGGTDREDPDVVNMTDEELAAIVGEAHAFKKHAACHAFTPLAQKRALAAGTDTLEHTVWTDDEAIEQMVSSQTPIVPTLLHRTDKAIEVARSIGISPFTLEKMRRIQGDCFATFQRVHQAGVPIAMGTDLARDPDVGTNAEELEIYVDLGMAPLDAVYSATRDAAAAIGLGDQVGTLEAGKAADLIAVDGDPDLDISCLTKKERILCVVKGGELVADRRGGPDRSLVSERAIRRR